MEGRPKTGVIRKLFRLWGIYARLDLLLMTRDLKTFLMWYFSDMVLNVAAVTGILLLAERFAGIGRWTKDQVIFMLAYASLVGGIVGVFFSYNISFISRRLGRGQLDHTLIQPQPLWLSLLTEGFSPLFGSAMILPGLGLMLWSMHRLSLVVSPGWLAMFCLDLAASAAVVLAFQFLWGSLAFWAPRGAEEISSSTMHLMEQMKSFPLDGLGPLLAGGLVTFLPVGFVAWYPCRSLLGLDRTAPGVWGTLAAATVLSAAACGVFLRGLKHYGRTGSQRYTDFGHRN